MMRFLDEILRDQAIDQAYKDFLDGIIVIDGSNIARYYFQETDQEIWYLDKDFPNVAPPFEKFWIDFQAPEKIMSSAEGETAWKANMPSAWGMSCVGTRVDTREGRTLFLSNPVLQEHSQAFIPFLDQAKWGLDMTLDMRQSGKLFDGIWLWRFLVSESGQFLTYPDGKLVVISSPSSFSSVEIIDRLAIEMGDREQALMAVYQSVMPYLHTTLLCISFMHCSNVSLDEVVPPVRRVYNKQAKKRGEKDYQPVSFKILSIQPMRQILRTKGQEAKNGPAKAMHICRGNFAHYTEGRGLFGKGIYGTFWRPMSVKGNKENGVVTKDYNVLPPEKGL